MTRKKKNIRKKTKKKKMYIKTKKKSISLLGLRDENDLYKSLTINNYNNIVKWVCHNLDIVVGKCVHNTIDGRYIIYRVGRSKPLNTTQKTNHIYIIKGNEKYGKGTWGSVSSGYIFDSKDYMNPRIMEMVLDNRKRKLKGYIHKKITNESYAFWLLLQNDPTYVRWLISKSPKYAIKIPKGISACTKRVAEVPPIIFKPL